MGVIGTIELTYSVECRCGKECKGSSLKWAYFSLLRHARMCELIEDPPNFLKACWELFWWKPGKR